VLHEKGNKNARRVLLKCEAKKNENFARSVLGKDWESSEKGGVEDGGIGFDYVIEDVEDSGTGSGIAKRKAAVGRMFACDKGFDVPWLPEGLAKCEEDGLQGFRRQILASVLDEEFIELRSIRLFDETDRTIQVIEESA
jgi:hypothetical protein